MVISIIAVAAVPLAVVLGLSPAAGTAGPSVTGNTLATNTGTDQAIAEILADNAGSSRINAATVQIRPGVVIRLLPPAAAPDSASEKCPGGYLCLFQDRDFGSAILQLAGCALTNLYTMRMPNRTTWNDQASSIDNPSPRPREARFYNYKGSGDPMNLDNDAFVLSLADGHYLRNLAKDPSADGGTANDKIDIVDPC